MTAHMAQSSARCPGSHTAVIIQALAPVIGPYMSRAMTTIHIQQSTGSTINSATTGARSYRNADSRIVRVGSFGPVADAIDLSLCEVGRRRNPAAGEVLTDA